MKNEQTLNLLDQFYSGRYYKTKDIKSMVSLVGVGNERYIIGEKNIIIQKGHRKILNEELIMDGIAGGIYVSINNEELEDKCRKVCTKVKAEKDGTFSIVEKSYMILRKLDAIGDYRDHLHNQPIVFTTENPITISAFNVHNGKTGYLINPVIIEDILENYKKDLKKSGKSNQEIENMASNMLNNIERNVDSYKQVGNIFKQVDFDDVYNKPRTYINPNMSNINKPIEANKIDIFYNIDLDTKDYKMVAELLRNKNTQLYKFSNNGNNLYMAQPVVVIKPKTEDYIKDLKMQNISLYIQIPSSENKLIEQLFTLGLAEEFELIEQNNKTKEKTYFKRNLSKQINNNNTKKGF